MCSSDLVTCAPFMTASTNAITSNPAIADGHLYLRGALTVAVFDADFMPPTDWLRGAMAALLAEERAAFVQTRIEWGNGDRNWLTRAQRLMQDSEAYKSQVVAQAEGDVARFNSVYSAYSQAPEVTRQRMYIEAIESILGQIGRAHV